MGTLLISADQIQEAFIGDIDGNGFEDLILRTQNDQLKVYSNHEGVFDVDGKLACLNTNVALHERTQHPESLSGVSQLFLEDMDRDGKQDIVTLDLKGYLKIFYGKGNVDKHTYLSQEVEYCDAGRSSRQEASEKIIKKF